ncbi:GTPase Era [Saccharicrinis sp. FJH54]|uniref:GTPase Era n=1 Tax=Saccharicrinis sp. FJH54 TaxID=3344665 RepID=UPI0035D4B549
MAHKAGFVNIVGNPNVGKSTLMNLFVGERLSIITNKSQTTRHRILGIINGDDFQIIFSDTPGVVKPHYKLQESMLKFSNSALEDADVLLYVTDVVESKEKNIEFIEKVRNSDAHQIVVINKIDLTDQSKLEELVDYWKQQLPKAEIYPVSALHKFNADLLFKRIVSLIPDSPPYFEKDALTDRPERFFVSEIIREKIFERYKEEVPYSTEVNIEQFKEDKKIIHINAVILVERESQKGIIIGNQGKALKGVGTEARKDIEKFLGKQVFLQIFVKVQKDWRNNDNQLKQFGYE